MSEKKFTLTNRMSTHSTTPRKPTAESGRAKKTSPGISLKIAEYQSYQLKWGKLAESEEDLLEHRTDRTDAFDTLYIGCEKFPFRDTFALSMSGVV